MRRAKETQLCTQTSTPLPAAPWSASGTGTAIGVTCRTTLQSTVGGQMEI